MNFLNLTLYFNGYNLKNAQEWLSENKGHKETLRDNIVNYHINHNPLYQEIIKGKEISKFEDLPIITKRDFQRPLPDMISDEYSVKDVYVSNTSGSSGHPFFFAKNKECHAITHQIIANLYADYGISSALKQARFYGIPASGVGLYKEKIKDFLANRVRFPVFDLSDEKFDIYLRMFRKHRFGYVYGYTSAITLFAKYLIRNSIILKNECPTLLACIVTSEVCTPEDRAIICKAFGVKVINEYGCSESGLIAFENKLGEWQIVQGENYIEVVDEKDQPLPYGSEGRILLTSVTNKAMPIIRYEIGDIGIIDKSRFGDYEVLVKLSGRVSDVIKLPSGRIAAGLTFYYVSKSVMEQNHYVKEFIVRQIRIDTFVFDVVADKKLTAEDHASLQNELDRYLEPGLKLIVNEVDHITRPASGKIKHFYSEI